MATRDPSGVDMLGSLMMRKPFSSKTSLVAKSLQADGPMHQAVCGSDAAGGYYYPGKDLTTYKTRCGSSRPGVFGR